MDYGDDDFEDDYGEDFESPRREENPAPANTYGSDPSGADKYDANAGGADSYGGNLGGGDDYSSNPSGGASAGVSSGAQYGDYSAPDDSNSNAANDPYDTNASASVGAGASAYGGANADVGVGADAYGGADGLGIDSGAPLSPERAVDPPSNSSRPPKRESSRSSRRSGRGRSSTPGKAKGGKSGKGKRSGESEADTIARLKDTNRRLREKLKGFSRLLDEKLAAGEQNDGKEARRRPRDWMNGSSASVRDSEMKNMQKRVALLERENKKLRKLADNKMGSEHLISVENQLVDKQKQLKDMKKENRTLTEQIRRLTTEYEKERKEVMGNAPQKLDSMAEEVRTMRARMAKYQEKLENSDRQQRKVQTRMVSLEKKNRDLEHKLQSKPAPKRSKSSKDLAGKELQQLKAKMDAMVQAREAEKRRYKNTISRLEKQLDRALSGDTEGLTTTRNMKSSPSARKAQSRGRSSHERKENKKKKSRASARGSPGVKFESSASGGHSSRDTKLAKKMKSMDSFNSGLDPTTTNGKKDLTSETPRDLTVSNGDLDEDNPYAVKPASGVANLSTKASKIDESADMIDSYGDDDDDYDEDFD